MAEEFDNIKESVEEKVEQIKEKAEQTFEKVKADIDDFTDEVDPEDIAKNKIYAVFAYLGIFVLVPIILAKDSKFARFHANQGLVLFIISVVCSIFMTTKLIGWVFRILGAVCFVFAVIGIIYAIQGKAKELPVIGNVKILK